jgi:hypothetical protein
VADKIDLEKPKLLGKNYQTDIVAKVWTRQICGGLPRREYLYAKVL